MERKCDMAYPPSSHASGLSPGAGSGMAGRSAVPPRPQASTPRCQQDRESEGEHELEKLEFALAVALTRGDTERSLQLRERIAALGGNQEEPGT